MFGFLLPFHVDLIAPIAKRFFHFAKSLFHKQDYQKRSLRKGRWNGTTLKGWFGQETLNCQLIATEKTVQWTLHSIQIIIPVELANLRPGLIAFVFFCSVKTLKKQLYFLLQKNFLPNSSWPVFFLVENSFYFLAVKRERLCLG